MDIIYYNCTSLGGFCCGLLLLDIATQYSWFYGLKKTKSNNIINYLSQFWADASQLPKHFHANFDRKWIGGKCLWWIDDNKSKTISAPEKRHSAKGLVKCICHTLIQTGCEYLTENQIPCKYYYWVTIHGNCITNHVPGRLNRKLTSPFELVHGVKPDLWTWFELFTIGFFHHQEYGNFSRSKSKYQTMAGISISRCPLSSNTAFYNPNKW